MSPSWLNPQASKLCSACDRSGISQLTGVHGPQYNHARRSPASPERRTQPIRRMADAWSAFLSRPVPAWQSTRDSDGPRIGLWLSDRWLGRASQRGDARQAQTSLWVCPLPRVPVGPDRPDMPKRFRHSQPNVMRVNVG